MTGPVSHDGRECRRHIDHFRFHLTDSDSTIPRCQRGQVDTDTEITPYNSYRPFNLVLSSRETEAVASILDTPMASVAPETYDVERDNVVTDTRDIAVSTPILELPRVTTPAINTGRSPVAPAWQAVCGMD